MDSTTPQPPSFSASPRRAAIARVVRLAVVNAAVFVGLVGALEAGARFLFPRQLVQLFDDPLLRVRGRPFVVSHPSRGFALNAGFVSEMYHVDSAGFRGAERPAMLATDFKIVALGESTTFGFGVRDDETYPFHLQRLLAAHGATRPPRVINAGVPSYTSSQVLAYLDELLPVIQPDLIIINIAWNDIWFSTLRHWYPEVLIFQRPPAWRTFLMQHSGVYRALALSADETGDVDIFNEEALRLYRSNLTAMVDACKRRHVPLVFMQPPIDPERIKDNGINPFQQVRFSKPFLLDVAHRYLSALTEIAAAGNIEVATHRLTLDAPAHHGLFLDLLHPTAEGNALMAQDLAAFLDKAGLLDSRNDFISGAGSLP